ncbi:MAG TPA: hypothetical protein P5060_01540 [Candidatus Absconditabacterales bacterium]|nr:hypothetical protein [Candidatus Absconditabacterales bacterium]
MVNIEKYKGDIAERYIQDFKKELNFLEKAMIFPIADKMKEILKSKDKIDVDSLGDIEELGFWRKILGAKIMNKKLFEKLTNKTFDFLKEKQEKIIQAETSGRLEELSELVINGKLDELDDYVGEIEEEPKENNVSENNGGNASSESENSTEEGGNGNRAQEHSTSLIVAGGTAVGGTTLYYSSINRLNKAAGLKNTVEISSESVDVARTKNAMQKAVDFLKEKSRSPKINKSMENAYKKSIKVFEESISGADGIGDDVFRAYQKLGAKIPDKYFNKFKASNKTLNAIDAMPEEDLKTIVGKSSKEIKEFFAERSLKCSDDLADMLRIAETASDIKGLSQVAKHGSKLSKVAKGLKGLSAIAVISMGIDVFVYFETLEEAKAIEKINQIRGEVKRDQATAQLMVGVASLVAEAAIIIGTCAAGGSMGGPIGTAVGLVVGAIAFATSVLLDELHYDKKAFYGQNRYDFIQQHRTTIKQSIVNLLESDRLDMNEKMKEKLAEDAEESGIEINTMEDAREALIYQEEILEGGYSELQYYYFSGESQEKYEADLKSESEDRFENYTKQKEEMENIISIRMEYIRQYINKDTNSTEYKEMKDMIQQNKGVNFVQKVLADSKVYYHLKQENPDDYISNYKDLDVDGYKVAYQEKLKSEYPERFDILEKLSTENPVHLHEIITGFELSKSSIESGLENGTYISPEKESMESNLDFLGKYYEYRKLGRPIEETLGVGIKNESNTIDQRYIEQILIDFDSMDKRPLWDKQESLNYFSNKDMFQPRLEATYQASDSTGQNILYSMAREFHGYNGDNTTKDIMDFYNAGNQDSTGLYYDNGWRVNQDLDWTQKFQYLAFGDLVGMIAQGLDLKFDLNQIDTENMSADEVYNKIIEGKSFADYISTVPWHDHLPKAEGLDSAIEAADQKIIAEFKAKAKVIIEREIGYRDNKEKYEQKIVDFVKTQSQGREGYLEIPYDMVIEAKKAKIGDIENYLFKYENNQIIALSTGYHINESLNFDKTNIDVDYEALSPLRESLSPEEKAIVDRVSASHQRLEKLRSLQSGWKKILPNSQKDDLDIPVEIERQMSKKWHDRKDIEGSLLYMTPLSSQLILEEKWEEYYNYFEDTYIGIMATVSQFSRGDKMGNIGHMNSAFAWSNAKIIDIDPSNNELFISNNIELEDDEKYFLLHYIKKTKDEETGKTVEELLKSTDDNEIKKGTWMSKQILISILESETIVFTENGEIKRIGCNVDPKDERITDGKMGYWQEPYTDPETGQTHGERYRVDVEPSTKSTKVMEERIRFHLGEGSITSLNQGLDELDTNSLETKNQTIRKVSESEESGYKKIDDMTANIISTIEKVDRAGRRGDPKFLAYSEKVTETEVPGKFKSRGTSVDITVFTGEEKEVRGFTIDTGYAKIAGLNIKFNNLQEAFRFANIINWIKGHYLKENPDRKGEFKIRNSGKLVNVKGSNITILKKSTVKDYYGSIEDSDTNQSKFLSYINNL